MFNESYKISKRPIFYKYSLSNAGNVLKIFDYH